MTTSNREWLRRQVEAEDGGFVSTGGLVLTLEQMAAVQSAARPLRQAFARLVQLKRRERALSLEDFARRAEVDLAEVVDIETNELFVPTAFCVHRIAAFFALPERPLMALAGLLSLKDAQFQNVSLRFAARSAPIDELSHDEREQLDEYVKFLCER
jgi:hypothetical protein